MTERPRREEVDNPIERLRLLVAIALTALAWIVLPVAVGIAFAS